SVKPAVVDKPAARVEFQRRSLKELSASREPGFVINLKPQAQGLGLRAKPEAAEFGIKVPTTDQQSKRLAELAEIFEHDKSEERLRYNTRKAEIAAELAVTPMDVHRGVQKWIKDNKKEKRELTQSQSAVALMLDQQVQLWIDPSDRTPHVSVIVGKHC